MVHKMVYEGEDKIGYYKCKEYSIYFLADGHGDSDYISSYLKNNFINYFKPWYNETNDIPKSLKLSINQIDDDLKSYNEGSTLVGFVNKDMDIIVFNIGDSRLYGIDKNNNLIKMTHDHNLYNENEIKRLNYKIQKNNKDRRLGGRLSMTRSIGDNDIKHKISTPSIQKFDKSNFKYLMLCSDGVYTAFEDDNVIKDIILHTKSIQKTIDTLLEYSRIHGDDDDKSILLKKIL